MRYTRESGSEKEIAKEETRSAEVDGKKRRRGGKSLARNRNERDRREEGEGEGERKSGDEGEGEHY